MLYFLQMLQMNFFFLMSIFAAAICVSMNSWVIYLIFIIGLGILFGYLTLFVDDDKPFKVLKGQSKNYSLLLILYLTGIAVTESIYTIPKFYRYFECDDRALTVKFDQLRLPQKKTFLHLENYSVRPVRDLNLSKSWDDYGAVRSNWYHMTEMLADPVKQEKTNIWLVCEKCSFAEAKERMNGKNAYITRGYSGLADFLPRLDPDADRETAIFYILLRGSLEDERNAILKDFFTVAGYANLGFLLIVIILMIWKRLRKD